MMSRPFLSFVGYYRRFIKGFNKVALPLRKLLIGLESQGKKAAKHTPVDWGEEEQNAFDTIVFFTNSFAATAGTNTRNATFKIVHSALL